MKGDISFKRQSANALHEAFYQDMCEALKKCCADRPEIRNVEIIAIMGRLIGYCIAMAFPDERDLARALAIENIDRATKDVSQ